MAFDLPGVMPNSDEETLFKAVGFIVVQWGVAEHVLDMLVAIIFPIVKDKIKDKKQPQFLTHKTKFVRNHINCHPVLQQLSGEITKLLERFEQTGKKRNDLVHGAITALSPENGSFKFAKLCRNRSSRTLFLPSFEGGAARDAENGITSLSDADRAEKTPHGRSTGHPVELKINNEEQP